MVTWSGLSGLVIVEVDTFNIAADQVILGIVFHQGRTQSTIETDNIRTVQIIPGDVSIQLDCHQTVLVGGHVPQHGVHHDHIDHPGHQPLVDTGRELVKPKQRVHYFVLKIQNILTKRQQAFRAKSNQFLVKFISFILDEKFQIKVLD